MEETKQFRRLNSQGFTEEDYAAVLFDVYFELLKQDAGVEQQAYDAFTESKSLQDIGSTLLKRVSMAEKGKVNRRAPLNPLASPRMGRFRKKGEHKQKKLQDPALKNNPLRGRLVMLLTSSAVLFFIFLQSLCFNKTEYSTFHTSRDQNSLIGPSAEVLLRLGGLSVNQIRNNGETFRLFWSMWMHAGWIHIILNIACQLQYLFMFEPDWGMTRVMLIYVISGITGNLISAVCNPCTTTVGSSGALFGLMGAMITYCLEFWTTIPRPRFLLGFSVVVVVLSLLTGFTSQTDNWAHMGGVFGGICVSLATLPTVKVCAPVVSCTSHLRREKEKKVKAGVVPVAHPKGVVRRGRVARFCQTRFFMRYSCGRWEWILRSFFFFALVTVWVMCFCLIYVSYEYNPLGQLTFSGFKKCYCCYEGDSSNWYCRSETYIYNGLPWNEYCATTHAMKETFHEYST